MTAPRTDVGAALGASTSPEAAAPMTVLLPLGSCEQHGPHLPLDTDLRIAVAIAERVAARAAATPAPHRVVVAPALAYGASGEHQGFPGTLSIGTDALVTVVVELLRSAGPEVRHLVAVNGHGGNAEALARAATIARRERRPFTVWSPRLPPGGDLHAGHTETSVLLAIAPGVVCLDRAERGNTGPIAALGDRLRRGGVAAVSPNGVLGDPVGASDRAGRAILESWCTELEQHLSQLRTDE